VASSTARPHQHEGLVRRHAEEPRREARLGAERAEAPDDLHQRRLEKVAAVLVAHRVPEQLALDMRRDHAENVVESRGLAVDGEVESATIDREGHRLLAFLGVRDRAIAMTVPAS
jgi:hypothetical protein